MNKENSDLFIRCTGAHCKNLLKVNKGDLSTCADEQNVYFGIYGRCEKPGCDFENLVREDHFESSDVRISCPGCKKNLGVTTFHWKKPETYELTFASRCDHCKRHVEVNINI